MAVSFAAFFFFILDLEHLGLWERGIFFLFFYLRGSVLSYLLFFVLSYLSRVCSLYFVALLIV